ncbi:S8 family serine peptidase [Sphingobacterium composti Ten et al. 2007 non Yoo et al. 2007]|uniref:S8 family serine peptidase n=1 Tax=Sphingobacterium composti TaxID=363260 RepID=UPI001F320F1C|nr:S8 family serine peptidase [Sphingobacterium composti Ten et al. 2007 non Yoo et al. 2007]
MVQVIFFTASTFAQQVNLPIHWHHQNSSQGYYGVNTIQAYNYLKNQNISLKPIVVAVIDGDLDTNHEDLKDNLWINQRSVKRKDTAVHGWNFLGTADNKLISKVGTEAFREYKRLRPKYENTQLSDWKKKKDIAEFNYFLQVKKDAKIQGYLNFFPIIKLTYEAFRLTDSTIKAQGLDEQCLSIKELANLKSTDSVTQEYIEAAKRSSFRYAETTKWTDLYAHQVEEFKTAQKRIKSLDDQSNPRFDIGDNIKSLRDKNYGNPILIDSNSFHGTFVGGLIAANRKNEIGINGVADNAKLMGLRAVPDGDEFDKDIALAIRFAVDNGANIINMSFGKYYSPNSEWVTDALAYAMKKNVIIVQAAGNDNRNLDTINCYPIRPSKIKDKYNSYLRIGASTSDGKKAKFSNFGSGTVDFFAPGENVTSTATFNNYKTANGTSFAAPIVSGVAALIWGAYPELKAYQVVEILKKSAAKNNVMALTPYAVTAGIVDAYQALLIAKEYDQK